MQLDPPSFGPLQAACIVILYVNLDLSSEMNDLLGQISLSPFSTLLTCIRGIKDITQDMGSIAL